MRLLRLVFYAAILFATVCVQDRSWGQQTGSTTLPTGPLSASSPLFGGGGNLVLSQFANPALVGALYSTPYFPLTGYYPLYPGGFSEIIRTRGVSAGPVILHPTMGVAEMYTDNVFRTRDNRRSDFFTTLSPGIQAQLPFMSDRHVFVADYRSNIQFYHRTPSNNVQDQTASGRLQFNFPWGLRLDMQGEHKLGHDPRGSAVDLLNLAVNKWTTNGFTGRASYQSGQVGIAFIAQSLRWNFLNNNQAVFRDRLTNVAGLTLIGDVSPKTAIVVNVRAVQEVYDQNKNLDSTVYTASAGARWQVTGKTTGEILVGYQLLKFNNAPIDQQGPVLSLFNREQGKDSAPSVFVSGNLTWRPTSGLQLAVQPYRSIQQTVFIGTFFFTATGVNLSAVQRLTSRIDATANLGFEKDRFDSSAAIGVAGSSRSDTLKNVAVGLNYRAVKWIGVGLQYVFEERTSNQDQFSYQASTAMVSVQALF